MLPVTWLPEKPRLPLCLALWLPAQHSSGASPVYGRRELEAGPEVWPDQRLKPLTAKGKGFLEFGAWEVHLGLQYRNLQGYLHSSWACVFMNIILLCSNLCNQRIKNAVSWLSTACWDSGFTPVVTIYMLLLETLR